MEVCISFCSKNTQASISYACMHNFRGICSALKRILGLIPWGALLAVSLMMTGLVMHLVNSKKTANNSLSLTKVTQSENVGYPYRLHVFSGSYAVTAGLAAGCIVASCILALVRLKQKLIHEEKNKGI